ncbi:MAG: sensor histidine kinase, partial [Acidobacteriota bacterium]
DILSYSRPPPPMLQRYELPPIRGDAAAAARAAVTGPSIPIEGPTAVLQADPEMTRAVLLNLLANACHASGSREIDVHIRVADALCDIEIRDRGDGIPAAVRDQLFEPFVSARPGGTGLGLAISRRLTQLQGGTLAIEDRPGGGTIARVTLPLAQPFSDVRTAAG